ncbi:BREX-1 system adenine-specific DNA-methyltransferase PglX [Epilithonimonas tenax]|uniref:BREX-1 system adenine-specific DNA-methyltransferase PglX n=1 Tax=Epilithonimonas tenax TaxID=191577 RepID=UPI0004102BC9|nr:BREX-1 system adenine-specific DNA-methyltransferase PglX [Epilithonimonas tenax]
MNTSQIKRFAQEARKKLITLVGGKLEAVLTQDSGALRAKAEVIEKLNDEISEFGKDALIDKVAYNWFNRLVALRFMDANDYQPLGINILSPAKDTATSSPQILSDIHSGIFPADLKLDKTYINELLNGKTNSSNPDNDIFREVLIAVCNDLHRIFPFLFERIDDYSELLLPDDLTSSFSIIADVVNGMSIEDCAEVEIIGWLYQFYISEKKDEVFASKSKVKKEDIPAATQLFTPRWIVEYMVQNTVGKLWLQNHPQSGIKQLMPYYIESPEGNADDYLKISSVEEIKLLDQACGSGHILVYGFELLAKIYEEQGYSASEIPAKIIENNLYGLEIDERAAQLAAFAITMKARQFYRRFYRNPVVPHIICYEDSKLNAEEIESIITKYKITNKDAFKYDLKLLEQATNLGSLIQPKTDTATLENIKKQLTEEGESSDLFWQQTQEKLIKAIQQLTALAQKYHCVVQNPPYMGGGKYNDAMSQYVNLNYPDSKADLFSCFIERSVNVAHPKGLIGNVTMESWMFLSSFEKFRNKLLENTVIDSLSHFGWHIMRIAFGTVAFILKNAKHNGTDAGIYNYLEIEDINREIERPFLFPNKERRYSSKNQRDFAKISSKSIAYWLSDNAMTIFKDYKSIEKIANPRQGLASSDVTRFIKFWSEVALDNISRNSSNNEEAVSSQKKWFPHNKGGGIKKWYGNNFYIINWQSGGQEIIKLASDLYGSPTRTIKNMPFYFKPSITWGMIGAGRFTCRISRGGFIFDVGGPSAFCDIGDLEVISGYLNSNTSFYFLQAINPTLNYNSGDLGKIPFKSLQESSQGIVIEIVKSCEQITKSHFDTIESDSLDFSQNELIRFQGVEIKSAINSYKDYWALQFRTLHQNEEELNRQFIDIYGLQEELTPDVPLEDITILKEESKIVDGQLVFKEEELIAQLLSYAVGCIFGRYSLYKQGLILANQGETLQDYLQKTQQPSTDNHQPKFLPDEDNVIPVLDEEWFDDDIVNRVKIFIRTVWGDASYQDNIQYIETVLGKDLRKYLTKDFYKDHIKRYKKRPIYWMFSSPKGHFNVMIYMHRYTTDTLNFILNSYLRPYMEKVSNDIKRQEDIIITGSAVEQGKARKRQDLLKDILKDCEAYEYDILYPLAGERIAIDLDNGVLVNYNKFGNAIASVAGLNDAKTKKKVKEFDWIDISTIR